MADPTKKLDPRMRKDREHLVRVEEDVDRFLRDQAAQRRVSIAQVIRESIYDLMRKTNEPNGD